MLLETADWWRDVVWFDDAVDRVSKTARGELWFVTGNFRGALDQVRERGRDLPNCVVVDGDPDRRNLSNELVALGETAAGVISPILEFAVALTRTVFTGSGPSALDVDLFTRFDQAIGLASASGASVVFLVDGSCADPTWARLLAQLTARRGRLRTQRLLMVIGLPDAPVGPPLELSTPSLLSDAAELIRERKARWLNIPSLSSELVMDRVRASAVVAQRLVTVTAGDDSLARQRWRRWVHDRHLEMRGGSWEFVAGTTDSVVAGIERSLDIALVHDRARVDRMSNALAIAALSGEEFCALAVASATVGEPKASALVREFQALTEAEHVAPLLAWTESACVANEGGIRHLRFNDEEVAAYFVSTFDDDERTAIASELLRCLKPVHAMSQDFDECLRRVALEAGDPFAAEISERLALKRRRERLLVYTAVLVGYADSWDPGDLYLWAALCEVVHDLRDVGLGTAALPAAALAARLARQHFTEPSEGIGWTLHFLAHVHGDRGEEEDCVQNLLDAVDQFVRMGEDVPTQLIVSTAKTFSCLGDAYRSIDALDEAVLAYEQSVRRFTIALRSREDTDIRRRLSATFGWLGHTLLATGNASRAVLELENAVAVMKEGSDSQPLSADDREALYRDFGWLADAHLQAGLPGEVWGRTQALNELLGVLRAAPECPPLQRRLAAASSTLGSVLLREGRPSDAIAPLRQAVQSYHVVLHDDESDCEIEADLVRTLDWLGGALRDAGQLEDAEPVLAEAANRHSLLIRWDGDGPQVAQAFFRLGDDP